MLRAFELYDVSVDDPRAGVQRVVLWGVQYFFWVGEPAHTMYEDHVSKWHTYPHFFGHLYLQFQ